MKFYKFITTYSEFVLNETLKTHDIDFTINNISNELSLLRYNFSIIKNANNTFQINLHNFNHIQNIGLSMANLNNLAIDRNGWFPSKMFLINISSATNTLSYDEEYLIENIKYLTEVHITYESKFDIEINIPDVLYHLSIQEFESDIINKGLVPKSKSKLSKHLDRIYVCSDIKNCYNLINRMKLHYTNKSINNKINDKWIIYKIDTKNLNIKLYKDPNYNDGFYIIQNIDKIFISIIDKEN